MPAPQYVAVYDVVNDELLDVIEESRCPQLYSRPFVETTAFEIIDGEATPGFKIQGSVDNIVKLR